MPQTLEDLTRQMGSMSSIHSVVRTMKTLSVINSAPYERAGQAIEAYNQIVKDGLHAFVRAAGLMDGASETPGAVGAHVLVVFGSDHGLCGNYNEVLAATVARSIKDRDGDGPTVLCVGAQMADALADQSILHDGLFLPPASVDGIGRLANALTRHLDDIRRDAAPAEIAVDLAYTARSDGGAQEQHILPLLPLNTALLHELQARPWSSRTLPTFTAPPAELFQALIRGYLFSTLFKASAEAMVSENAARLALMSQAEQSVEDRLDDLKAEANTLRQSGITSELLDVIIGFEALKKPRKNSKAKAS
ncbi:ATPase [Aliishimia ponticola]|uniref:ATPase n=1 Tax=Aliishimia ponticola TaxID=2499833 RepID=A0A4S4NBX6_9RHOB|nr:FoF1 ATP synthase subunit gamma [Aliishimia ponticola]THH36916.1 ATPase [Aliishimia ponticola]